MPILEASFGKVSTTASAEAAIGVRVIENTGDQWPGSRAISAQKANTANAFSLPEFALSSANLHQATQDGGSLYGLQESNPIDVSVAYAAHLMLTVQLVVRARSSWNKIKPTRMTDTPCNIVIRS
jgi:hypothetical protein